MVRFQTYSNLTRRKNSDREGRRGSAALNHIMDNIKASAHEGFVRG